MDLMDTNMHTHKYIYVQSQYSHRIYLNVKETSEGVKRADDKEDEREYERERESESDERMTGKLSVFYEIRVR